MQYFHVKDIAKLAMFESQKEAVCTIHLWNPKERLRRRNQRDRDRRAAIALNKGRHG